MLARGTKITQLPVQKCSTLWWYSRIPTSLTLEPWWFSGQNVRSSIRRVASSIPARCREIFVAPGEHGLSFFQVKMFIGSVRVLLTCASLKLKSNYQELGYTIHLMSDPEGNSQFCFPKSPDVSLDFVSGNIRTRGKTKLTGFPRDLTLSVCYFSRLSLQHQQKNNQSEPIQSTRYL